MISHGDSVSIKNTFRLLRIALFILVILLSFGFRMAAQNSAGKFIPTYFIKYGSTPQVTQPGYISARFDMVIASSGYNNLWAESGLNSWQTLKKYNPEMIIALYQLGPSEYNTASWGLLGDGWEWIKNNHGASAGAERWTGSGHKFSYLANVNYPNERLMYLGNPGWQEYWTNKIYDNFWISNLDKYKGADAIFSDNTNFNVAWPGSWYEENNTGNAAFKDHPLDYATADGVYDNAKWKADMKSFFNRAVPALASKNIPVRIILNFGYMGKNPEYWRELDTMKNTVYAAMEEGAFTNPWSKTYNIFDWETKIKVMKDLKNVVALMNNTGKVPTGDGMAKMDVVMSEGNMGPASGWDALWFSMTSFLLALNESKTSGYFGFNIWGYGAYYWLDEYDPKYLHLGKPLGDYFIPTSGSAKDVAFREYEDGWVVTNYAHTTAKTGVPVPSGKAWVVSHANLRNPYSDDLVSTFSIGKNRGLILLKEGRKIGNEDNIWPLANMEVKENGNTVEIFPNPVVDHVNIISGNLIDRIIIFDILGKQLKYLEPHAGKVYMDVSGLLPGCYFIKIRTDGKTSVHRLVKKN